MTELLLFASAFVSVFALGFQSLNVNGGHYAAAFLTSFAIGLGHLALYRWMPDAGTTQIAAYLLGGPLGLPMVVPVIVAVFGIVASMWTHRRTVGRRLRRG